ncbi:pro-sigmaK processing inhibitor BofA family protein [Caldibacillus thermoamylovorans]|uniref:pro-sigmaK processing inhibitor BofA family protein n=1 Tax=Caldibacillus thermoamylovorans TaxID=35841 RepID=UPI001D070614|nr:pro-sigmaK processing inhibitor BofA family protein [Caldibacillus thermoamylovorans]MCB5936697.1 pro-sigmaK processing inhibitor BofA family protein [Bacillus sp. DFI.2.34]MCB7078172.1 pro-sigmaK processing inhibitor BofA family protein [Caldibacillus thermoamylovorans]
MEPSLVIGIIGGIIVLLLLFGTPLKLFRFFGQSIIKILIGALLLFFLNAFGSNFGIHVPINLITATISGFLGIPGVCALTFIQLWII